MTGSRARAAVVLAIALIPASLAPPALAAAPTAGPQGVGDYPFPQLGNPGCDARHYDLGVRYATRDHAQVADQLRRGLLGGRAVQAHIFTPAPDDPFPFGWFAT